MRVSWEDVAIRVYVDTVELAVYPMVNFSWEDNIEIDEAKYQGASTPSFDGHYRGGSGTVEFRLEDGYGDPQVVQDAHVAGIKNRDNTGQIRLVVTKRAVGTSRREGYRFDNVILTPSQKGAENQSIAISWNFRYGNRLPLNS